MKTNEKKLAVSAERRARLEAQPRDGMSLTSYRTGFAHDGIDSNAVDGNDEGPMQNTTLDTSLLAKVTRVVGNNLAYVSPETDERKSYALVSNLTRYGIKVGMKIRVVVDDRGQATLVAKKNAA